MTTAAPEMATRLVAPRVNIIEREDAVLLEAELPGVPKDGINLEFKDGELILTGKRQPSNGEGRYHIQERARVDYRRVFGLSRAIDTQKIDAAMKDGVLTVTLHKIEAVKPRRINVN
jgi:HSP20 family protein